MKFRKLILAAAAAAAVAALAVVAGPVSATSSVWLHEGKPLEKHVELPLAGGEIIEVGGGVLLCESTATLTTEGGSTGKITNYNVNKASCTGLAGNLEGCEVTAAEATGLPWSVTVNTADLTAKGVKVDYTFNKGCAVGNIELNFPELTLTPYEEAKAFRLFEFSTEGTGKVDGKEATIGYFGSLQLPEAEFETYGIG
jgi:hypothetical protein